MAKVSRTFRIDNKYSKKLDQEYKRHGDHTWHIEQALEQYFWPKEVKKEVVKQEKAKAFTPPDYGDVFVYFGERGSLKPGEEAEKFIDFYSSKGWMVGKNKMKDWKAAVRNWMKGKSNEGQQRINQPSNVQPKKLSAVERVQASIERRRNGSTVGNDGGSVRSQMGEQLRGGSGPNGDMEGCIEGDFIRTD